MAGYIGYFVAAIIVGYFLGCIQTGYFVGRLCGLDIRQYGSGNAGTTNVLRTLGKSRALITFLGDALKGMIPVLIVKLVIGPAIPGLNSELLQLVLGFAVVLGHDFPFFLHFKGGKGIAATAGIIFSIDWRLTVLCLAVFVLIVAVTRYVSLGSLVVSVILLAWNIYMGRCGAYSLSAISSIEYSAVTAVIAAMAFWRHRANIVRLIHGNENKIGAKKS